MSGGSFNYLSGKDAEALVADYADNEDSDLRRMLDEIEALREEGVPGAHEAYQATLGVVASIEHLRAQIETTDRRVNGVSGVWHAIDWWRSGDKPRAEVERVLAVFKVARP